MGCTLATRAVEDEQVPLGGDVATLVGAGGVRDGDVHGHECRPLREGAQGPTGGEESAGD